MQETQVLGLRGLYVEARRRGDADTAWKHASEAARLAPAVDWANEAVLEGLCARGDWRAAIDTVERRAALGLIDKPTAKRHRAVLLTADALARSEADEEAALASRQGSGSTRTRSRSPPPAWPGESSDIGWSCARLARSWRPRGRQARIPIWPMPIRICVPVIRRATG